MSRHTRCAVWAACGTLLGLAYSAWAQAQDVPGDPSAPPTWAIELLKAGGLPGVVGIVGWWLGRGGGITLTVRLSDEDRRLLRLARGKETP